MRKALAIGAITALVALVLVGCSTKPDDGQSGKLGMSRTLNQLERLAKWDSTERIVELAAIVAKEKADSALAMAAIVRDSQLAMAKAGIDSGKAWRDSINDRAYHVYDSTLAAVLRASFDIDSTSFTKYCLRHSSSADTDSTYFISDTLVIILRGVKKKYPGGE